MCRLTRCIPSPCEVFTEQLSLWPAPLTPPTSPGSPQWVWQGGTLCLSTHSSLNHTHTLHFLRFQTLISSGPPHPPPYLLVSKLRSPELNLSQAQVFFSRVAWKQCGRTENSISHSACNRLTTSYRSEKTAMKQQLNSWVKNCARPAQPCTRCMSRTRRIMSHIWAIKSRLHQLKGYMMVTTWHFKTA